MDMLYKELRQIAAYHMQKERADHTLQPTALVHEAYKRLIGVTQTEWQSRTHFLAIASQVMRRVLIDYAKQHRSEKSGGGQTPLPLDGLLEVGKSSEKSFRLSSTNYDDLIALDEALKKLAALEPRQSRLIDLRFFGGLSTEEMSEVLGVTTRTILRDWNLARAWLHKELAGRES
jgi:RNA polymerase sigma-70 factor, ECF subfamily